MQQSLVHVLQDEHETQAPSYTTHRLDDLGTKKPRQVILAKLLLLLLSVLTALRHALTLGACAALCENSFSLQEQFHGRKVHLIQLAFKKHLIIYNSETVGRRLYSECFLECKNVASQSIKELDGEITVLYVKF